MWMLVVRQPASLCLSSTEVTHFGRWWYNVYCCS